VLECFEFRLLPPVVLGLHPLLQLPLQACLDLGQLRISGQVLPLQGIGGDIVEFLGRSPPVTPDFLTGILVTPAGLLFP